MSSEETRRALFPLGPVGTEFEFVLESEADTVRVAEVIAGGVRTVFRGDGEPPVIGLSGEMGVGKTAFVRALVVALGGRNEVVSPSYVLECEYPIADGASVSHWDLFRLRGAPPPGELFERAGLRNTVTVIEWPEYGESVLNLLHLRLMLAFHRFFGRDSTEEDVSPLAESELRNGLLWVRDDRGDTRDGRAASGAPGCGRFSAAELFPELSRVLAGNHRGAKVP